jgi:hypothetical protein
MYYSIGMALHLFHLLQVFASMRLTRSQHKNILLHTHKAFAHRPSPPHLLPPAAACSTPNAAITALCLTTGISQDKFDKQYAKKAGSALAGVMGVSATNVVFDTAKRQPQAPAAEKEPEPEPEPEPEQAVVANATGKDCAPLWQGAVGPELQTEGIEQQWVC